MVIFAQKFKNEVGFALNSQEMLFPEFIVGPSISKTHSKMTKFHQFYKSGQDGFSKIISSRVKRWNGYQKKEEKLLVIKKIVHVKYCVFFNFIFVNCLSELEWKVVLFLLNLLKYWIIYVIFNLKYMSKKYNVRNIGHSTRIF